MQGMGAWKVDVSGVSRFHDRSAQQLSQLNQSLDSTDGSPELLGDDDRVFRLGQHAGQLFDPSRVGRRTVGEARRRRGTRSHRRVKRSDGCVEHHRRQRARRLGVAARHADADLLVSRGEVLRNGLPWRVRLGQILPYGRPFGARRGEDVLDSHLAQQAQERLSAAQALHVHRSPPARSQESRVTSPKASRRSRSSPFHPDSGGRPYLEKSPASWAIHGVDCDRVRAPWMPTSLSAATACGGTRESPSRITIAIDHEDHLIWRVRLGILAPHTEGRLIPCCGTQPSHYNPLVSPCLQEVWMKGVNLPTETVFVLEMSPIKFGLGASDEIGYDARRLGLKRVLIVTDRHLVEVGLPDRIRALLDEEGIKADVYDGVEIEPTDRSMEEAAEYARQREVDGLIGVGGGSALDTCKAVNLLTTYPAPLLDYINKPVGRGVAIPGPLKPMIAVPTTAGTGSETTAVAVTHVIDQNVKAGLSHRLLRPAPGPVDPLKTLTAPPPGTAPPRVPIPTHP